MNKRKRIFKKYLSVLLILTILLSTVSACAEKEEHVLEDKKNTVGNTEIIEEENHEVAENKIECVSLNWEDYYGDVETFVYGLITNQLSYKYDIFPAYVKLKDGNSVFGIGYTNYEECYVNEEESLQYFLAGIIPYYGELAIPQEEFDEGLEIHNIEYIDKETSFVLAYAPEPFKLHCVAYGKYIQYGIATNGCIDYKVENYQKEICNESLGSLYSYDQQRYLYDVDMGEFVNLSGGSLYSQIDFEEFQQEINNILSKQDLNFATVEVEHYAYIAQEAVTQYLLSMQEENFLGYSVTELIKEIEQLDPMECYRMTANGLEVIELEKGGTNESSLSKWLVGSACAVAIAVGIVGSLVATCVPPVSATAGAMVGVGIEVFIQVVLESHTLEEVNWTKVAVAAVAGAVSGMMGSYILAKTSGVTNFVIDSAVDGLIGGIEQVAEAWIDGKSGQEMIEAFGIGVAMGVAISSGFKATESVFTKIAKKIGPSIKNASSNLFNKYTGKISKIVNAKKDLLVKKVESTKLYERLNKYIGKKIGKSLCLLQKDVDSLMEQSIKHLPKEGIQDMKGKLITKDELSELAKKADNKTILGYYIKDGDKVIIKKENNMVGIFFDEKKYNSVTLSNGLIDNRNANMIEAVELLKAKWLDNLDEIPKSIAEEIKKKNRRGDLEDILEDLTDMDLLRIIKKSDLVLHENIDLKTIVLVPRKLHDSAEGGLTHMGGFALAKYIKQNIGREFFDEYVSQISKGII